MNTNDPRKRDDAIERITRAAEDALTDYRRDRDAAVEHVDTLARRLDEVTRERDDLLRRLAAVCATVLEADTPAAPRPRIPLSLVVELAREHGGVYSTERGSRHRWPWWVPVFDGRRLPRGECVNCSTLQAAVWREVARRCGIKREYRHWAWMILNGTRPWSPLDGAYVLGIMTDRDTGVRLCQGWRNLDKSGTVRPGVSHGQVSRGHTWVEVDTPDGVRIIDATPDAPWRGVRVMEPRPEFWADHWHEVRSVNLDVDREA
jgi:hypothetical protein